MDAREMRRKQLAARRQAKGAGVKFEHRGQAAGKILRVMVPGIKTELVGNMA